MLMTCFTAKSLYSSTLRTRSANMYDRKLPMWDVSYTVGPQLYMRTIVDEEGSVNSCRALPNVLCRYIGMTAACGAALRRRKSLLNHITLFYIEKWRSRHPAERVASMNMCEHRTQFVRV